MFSLVKKVVILVLMTCSFGNIVKSITAITDNSFNSWLTKKDII